jgi:hypothetical protein
MWSVPCDDRWSDPINHQCEWTVGLGDTRRICSDRQLVRRTNAKSVGGDILQDTLGPELFLLQDKDDPTAYKSVLRSNTTHTHVAPQRTLNSTIQVPAINGR